MIDRKKAISGSRLLGPGDVDDYHRHLPSETAGRGYKGLSGHPHRSTASAVPDPGIPGQCPGKHLVNARLALAATFLHLIPTKVIAHACKPMLHMC